MIHELILIGHNHWDPTWRRCFLRPATYHGQTVRPYIEMDKTVIESWRTLASTGYTFSEGQVAVWREYLRLTPEAAGEIRSRLRNGTLEFTRCGETVQDSQLVSAEGLIRNFLLAQPFYDALCGPDHPGLQIAWMEDTFGNSPNYPQILEGIGCKCAARLSYRRINEPVWVGIDGTKLPVLDEIPMAVVGHYVKFPPCPSCCGTGCAACDNKGVIFPDVMGGEAGVEQQLTKVVEAVLCAVEADVQLDGNEVATGMAGAKNAAPRYVMVGGEETLPIQSLPAIMARLNQRYAGKVRLRFGTCSDVLNLARADLEKARAARDDSPSADLSPAMPGCMVTRIKTKQRTRASAYALVRAEATLANAQWRDGKPSSQPAALDEAWRLVAFNQFHDAITGTHIDCAYDELMDMLDRADAVARQHGIEPIPPPTPPAGTLTTGERRLRLGQCDCVVDQRGLKQVLVDGMDLFGLYKPARLRGPLRIGELWLESDFGDAWGTRLEPLGGRSTLFNGLPLGECHDAMFADGDTVTWHGVYDGGDPRIQRLRWRTTLRSSPDGERLEFTTIVDWNTRSRRLRVLIPVATSSEMARYEVPFGYVDRAYDRTQWNFSNWEAHQNEYPTLHWARQLVPDTGPCAGVALMTRGLPCVRWKPRLFDLSLLRSPEAEFCQVEQQHYEFWDNDGQRDTGVHVFHYSLWPHTRQVNESELTRVAMAYNHATPDLPFAVKGNVQVTAWKPAQDGIGWILRFYESNGGDTEASIDFGRRVTITPCDLLERVAGEPVCASQWRKSLTRFKLITLRIQPAE